MDTLERLAIEADCTRLMTVFTLCTDTFDYDKAIGLFLPDCRFSRATEVFEGHAGLRAIMERRDPTRQTRHILSNVVIDIADSDHASGSAYALVFGHRGVLEPGQEAPLTSPDSLVLFSGDFVRTADGWRIKRWHIGMSFRKVAA